MDFTIIPSISPSSIIPVTSLITFPIRLKLFCIPIMNARYSSGVPSGTSPFSNTVLTAFWLCSVIPESIPIMSRITTRTGDRMTPNRVAIRFLCVSSVTTKTDAFAMAASTSAAILTHLLPAHHLRESIPVMPSCWPSSCMAICSEPLTALSRTPGANPAFR